MAIEGFDYKDEAIGTGSDTDFTFDFKIYDLTHLLVYVQDASGVVVEELRGDDTTYISGVVFDSADGGGTVSLVTALPLDYTITFFLAPDEPSQPTSFPNKGSFSLGIIEGALDYLVSQIQRAAFLAQRAMTMHPLDDIDDFDPTLPFGIAGYSGGILSVKADGSGFEVAITTGEIAAAQGNADDAAAASTAAAASAVASAASAAASAASAAAASVGMTMYGTYAAPLDITAAGGIANNIVGEQGSFIHGSPGAVTISANPQIAAGTVIGQKITLFGCDDTNTVTFTNGNGLRLNGDMVLQDGDVISFIWNGAYWQEIYRSR